MLPTVTPSTDGSTASGASVVTLALDELLFRPGKWFAIDANNQRVRGVRAATLTSALALIGRGQVASIVGRLAPGVHAVDVDVEGPLGDAIVRDLIQWCLANDLWHLVRASGGAAGRHHVFVVPGAHDLPGECQRLRATYRRSGTSIDHRSGDQPRGAGLRPLSAPHRNGTPAGGSLGDLATSLTRLKATLTTAHSHTTPALTPHAKDATTEPLLPTEPAPVREPRTLDTRWHNYFVSGIAAPLKGQREDCPGFSQGPCGACGIDHSRSTTELHATIHLALIGHTRHTAWDVIAHAHPNAMTRTRAKGHSWWAGVVWTSALRALEANRRTRTVPAHIVDAVNRGRHQLHHHAWSLPVRQRPAFLVVGHHVLDRIERESRLRVPVPERNLLADTGLKDRATIRAALRALHARLGTLHTDTFDPVNGKATSSHEFELHPQAVSENPPPSLHTPLGPHVWAGVSPSAQAAHRTLRLTGGATASDLARTVGLVTNRGDQPTVRQLRTIIDTLLTLAHIGLAHCDADGKWHPLGTPTQDHLANAQRIHDQVTATITAERRAYRTSRSTSWLLGRARAYQTQIARERRWWSALPHQERNQRQQHLQQRFTALPVHEKQKLTHRLATKRRIAGESEQLRLEAWRNSHTRAEYADRCAQSQNWYYSLPQPERSVHVEAWNQHRREFGLLRSAESMNRATLEPNSVA